MLNVVDIRNRGVKAIEQEIADHGMATLGYRGKPKYVIVEIDAYEKFKEWELQHAYEEAKKEIESGRYTSISDEEALKKHIENL